MPTYHVVLKANVEGNSRERETEYDDYAHLEVQMSVEVTAPELQDAAHAVVVALREIQRSLSGAKAKG